MDEFFAEVLGPGIDEGDAVFLRPFVPADITDRYLAWFYDENVTRFLEARDLTFGDVLDHLVKGFASKTYFQYAIVERASGLHIGNCKIGPINLRHRLADLSIVIGDRSAWGKGYATTVLRLAPRLAFGRFDLDKLSAGVVAGNDGSRRAFLAAGWAEEAELPRHVVSDGERRSRFLYAFHRGD